MSKQENDSPKSSSFSRENPGQDFDLLISEGGRVKLRRLRNDRHMCQRDKNRSGGRESFIDSLASLLIEISLIRPVPDSSPRVR